MLDTVVLRFHGVLQRKSRLSDKVKSKNQGTTEFAIDEHHQLYLKMLKYDNKFFDMVQKVNRSTTVSTLQSESEFLYDEHRKDQNSFEHVSNVMRFVSEKKVREIIASTNGKFRTPSSINYVVYKINHKAGFIDFNLSIPKYLYGHSLAEFVPQPLSKTFFNFDNHLNSIAFQRKLIHKRFMEFLDKFCLDLASMFELDVLPNKDYIEIRRLDLCYNQYFENKADALNYLSHQKKIAKKKATHSNNKLDVHDTSLEYFTSSGGYFKIYHKGSEYISSKHGDLKKHQEFNKKYIDYYLNKVFKSNEIEGYNESTLFDRHIYEHREMLKNKDYVLSLFDEKIKGKPLVVDKKLKESVNKTAKILNRIQPYKIDFLKEEMDKVLRYEISLSGAFFGYQYKTHIFRNKPFRKKDQFNKSRQYDCCPYFLELKENYKRVHSLLHSKTQDEKINKKDLRDYKKLHEFYKRKIALVFSENQFLDLHLKSGMFDINKNANPYDFDCNLYINTLLAERDIGVFSDDFLQRCFDYFFGVVREFQLKKLDTYDTISERIKQYNQNVDKRTKLYNEVNHFKTKDNKGNQKVKGTRVITKATQLLTDAEKRKLKLKKVEGHRLMLVIRELQRGVSLHQIRDSLEMNKSTFSRLRADLKMFQVFEQTLEMEKEINVDLSYRQYYHNTKGGIYQSKFYLKPIQSRYG